VVLLSNDDRERPMPSDPGRHSTGENDISRFCLVSPASDSPQNRVGYT
jgi:hypothetical protein